ncbi:helix-turn-helix domain-containing protein [Paenibacillus maysiensis]|uniref:helix-turn-helix domain-containing protein n=1 Tax=Paenibacillus maysiensis TaxID=1155954 RepID=UPI00047213FA|nr:helix-turn-helix transcriptional regulator [Paenibacillus maysiensis]
MNHTTTIRAELDTYMKTNGLNITRLGRTAGLNAGTLSTLVNGNRTFSVDQLDRITVVMGHPTSVLTNYVEYICAPPINRKKNWLQSF